MNQMAEKKYTFLVHVDANKTQIKEAVEKMFEGTKVAKVNTISMHGRLRRQGLYSGYTPDWKRRSLPSQKTARASSSSRA